MTQTLDRWAFVALVLAGLCLASMVWSASQIYNQVAGATLSPFVESISALVLVAAAYYAKKLVDTQKETEAARRTVELLNSQLVFSGMQALTALLTAHHTLTGILARTNTMIAALAVPGFVATAQDELNINAVCGAYLYMSTFYSCDLLDRNLLKAYAIQIVTGFYVVEPMVRGYISRSMVPSSCLSLARLALSMLDKGLLQTMGLAGYTI